MSTTSTRHKLTIGVLVALVVAVGAVVWYLTRPAPSAVDIGAAADSVATPSEDDRTASEITSTDGTWTVDASIGEFSVTNTTGSFVGFRIDEELSTVGATTAIGRTPDVSGSITLDGARLTEATFTGDLTAIVSDQSRRDDNIQSALETSQFPEATFELAEPVDLGEVPAEGETVQVDARGELTIHGMTRQVTVPLQAQLTDGVIVVTGSTDIALSDYDVQAPTAPIVVSVADTATIEWQLFLTSA